MNEEKFTGKAYVYEKNRASYPKELISYLYNEVGFSKESAIADIGAGTGKMTKLLLEQGSEVYAVEPNGDMRNTLKTVLSDFQNLSVTAGTAENTEFKTNSMDFITAAQAFHWFDMDKFKLECQRILKKDTGKIVLVWNNRNGENSFVKEVYEISRKFCPDFKGGAGGMDGSAEQFKNFFKKGIYHYKVFKNPLPLTEDGFIGGCLSSSYSLKEGMKNYELYVNELREAFITHSNNGKLIMPFITQCYAGEV